MKTDTILQIVAVVVGSLTGIATYIVLKNLFLENKALHFHVFSPPEDETIETVDLPKEDPLKVG